MSDEAFGEVLCFVRGAWGNGAAGVSAEQVTKLRPVTDPSSDRVIALKMRQGNALRLLPARVDGCIV